jgi:quinol monooxygenase YgiN
MQNLMAVATFPYIAPENLKRFKSIAAEMLESINSLESILRYEVFFTSDETSCIVLEEYSSPAGVIEHVEKHAAFLQELAELGGRIQGQMFPLSDEGEAIEMIRDSWDSTMHHHFSGKRT